MESGRKSGFAIGLQQATVMLRDGTGIRGWM